MSILIVLIFFAVAWFLLILPRQRELRRHQALMAELEPGDDVIMSSGVYGTILEIDGDIVQIEVAPGVELKIAKRAVAAKVAEPEPDIDPSVVDLTEDELPDNGSTPPDRPDVTGA
jgi:preprotein translocase subunit YajC